MYLLYLEVTFLFMQGTRLLPGPNIGICHFRQQVELGPLLSFRSEYSKAQY